MQPERSTAVAFGAPKPGAAEPRRIEAADPRAEGRRRVVLLARDRVVIARCVAGVFMHIAMPPEAYRGVVLRLKALEDGVFQYEVSLAHRDPDLSVTLQHASDDSEIRAEWRLWANFLGLPTLVEREDGSAEPDAPRLGRVAITQAEARRRGKTITSRRPRFLTRRKVGSAGLANQPHERTREIFPGSKPDR
jgi:hypothetical protein